MRELYFDSLLVKIFPNRDEMGKAAASYGVAVAKEIISQKGYVNIIFAAAPSQFDLYKWLINSDLDFSKVNAFHMDEYIGLEDDAPQKFGNLLNKYLFSKVSFKTVNYINSSNDNPKEECRRYSALLDDFPPDIVFHGIGENGHLAFNDPHVANFYDDEKMKIVEMDDVCRMQQVHDGCFDELCKVPKKAYTLTIPTLTMATSTLIVTVPTERKRNAIKNTCLADISEKVPATILRKCKNAVLFTDEDAAEDLS